MSTASEKMAQIGQKINEKKAQASAVGAIYKFVLEGDGGGTWIVNLKDNPGVTEGDGPAECTLKMSVSDGLDLLEGRARGEQLFFAQKLRIEGDMGLAMRLQALLEIVK